MSIETLKRSSSQANVRFDAERRVCNLDKEIYRDDSNRQSIESSTGRVEIDSEKRDGIDRSKNASVKYKQKKNLSRVIKKRCIADKRKIRNITTIANEKCKPTTGRLCENIEIDCSVDKKNENLYTTKRRGSHAISRDAIPSNKSERPVRSSIVQDCYGNLKVTFKSSKKKVDNSFRPIVCHVNVFLTDNRNGAAIISSAETGTNRSAVEA